MTEGRVFTEMFIGNRVKGSYQGMKFEGIITEKMGSHVPMYAVKPDEPLLINGRLQESFVIIDPNDWIEPLSTGKFSNKIMKLENFKIEGDD